WPRVARRSRRRAVVCAAVTIAVLLAAASPVLKLQLTPGSNNGIPQNVEAVRGLNVLARASGEGAIAPTQAVIDTGRAGGASDPGVKAALARLTTELRSDPEVAPGGVIWGTGPQFVDRTGRYLQVQVVG